MAYTTIDDPSAHFQTITYTGNEASRSITNTGNSDLKPDWVWIKERNNAISHRIFDSSRGATKRMFSNNTDAESTQSNSLTAFNTDGFSLGDGTSVNGNSDTYVAWQWAANGGTTSSNSDGDITSTVQANTTAGFSIVTYTGTGGFDTVGHGLTKECDLVIIKNRDTAKNWMVMHKDLTSNYNLNLNSTAAEFHFPSQTTNGGIHTPDGSGSTSTTFSLGEGTSNSDNVNLTNDDLVAYCFHSVQGYSKFGSYTGNGNADGPFVYTGFKPALVIAKRTDGSGNDWRIADNKRDPFNIVDGRIKPNSSDAEDNADQFDFLSNGFKLRTTAGDLNGTSGHTFIYMAFAEHPFVSSKGVPVTAR